MFLPHDVLRRATAWLSPGARSRCRAVCGGWRDALDDGTAVFLPAAPLPDAARNLVFLPHNVADLRRFVAAVPKTCLPESLVLRAACDFRGACCAPRRWWTVNNCVR